jgi:hypothetical protein
MKFTAYFTHMHQRSDRQCIAMDWIERVVRQPDLEKVQSDGRIRRWKRIPEAKGRFPRVVLLEDGLTIHNAFFDRSFQEDEP